MYFFFFHSMSEEMQYIQQSIVPTMHFQDSLPRLPVPELNKTCDRYINALKPITDETKLQNTVKIIEKFKCEEGKGKSFFFNFIFIIFCNYIFNLKDKI